MKKNLCLIEEIWSITRTLRAIYLIAAMSVIYLAFGWVVYHIVKKYHHKNSAPVVMVVPAPVEPDEDSEDWPETQYVETLPLPTEKEITGIDLQLAQEWPKVPSDKVKRCRKK